MPDVRQEEGEEKCGHADITVEKIVCTRTEHLVRSIWYRCVETNTILRTKREIMSMVLHCTGMYEYAFFDTGEYRIMTHTCQDLSLGLLDKAWRDNRYKEEVGAWQQQMAAAHHIMNAGHAKQHTAGTNKHLETLCAVGSTSTWGCCAVAHESRAVTQHGSCSSNTRHSGIGAPSPAPTRGHEQHAC